MEVTDIQESRFLISTEGTGSYEITIRNGAIAEIRYRTGGVHSNWHGASALGLLNIAVKHQKEFNELVTALRRRVKK